MTQERPYSLLPSLYRQRDAELGEPLRALLGVIPVGITITERKP